MVTSRPGRALTGILCAFALVGCASLPDVGEIAVDGDPEAGTLILGHGQRRAIRFDSLRYTGSARFEWPDGRSYEGDFVAGRPSGHGVEAHPDGGRYEGPFEDGLPHGRGRFDYADGSVYEGDWVYGQRSGRGSFERTDGASYDGDWENDLPNGFGIMREWPGIEYDGAFEDGQRSGYGVLEFGDDVGYAGMWLANQRHGWGREQRPDGSTYVGEWRHDFRHGTGNELHVDGSFHDGSWELDRPLGLGARRTSDGIEISGLWNGNFVASGVIRLPSGAEYAGNLYESANRKVNARFLAWLQSRADGGDPQAAQLLGDAYRFFTTPPPNPALAAGWYAKAAANGSAEAAFRLADVVAESGGANESIIEALETAAAVGHPRANSRLGEYHQLGTRLPKDPERARERYQAAMTAGDLTARNNLAWLLATTTDDGLRDGARAVRLARPMALFYDHWTYLDTLAAAFAEVGDFTAARRTATRAVALAEGDAPAEVLAEIKARLERYERSEPYREP